VVEYNTSTNPTFEGAVRDTSGRGLDGVLYNGASYSAIRKELVFDGSNDIIARDLPPEFVGDPELTISMWVNPDTLANSSGQYDTFVHLGRNSDNAQIQLTHYGTDGGLQLGGYGQGMKTNSSSLTPIGQWTHLCAVLTPGAWSTTTKKLYINGKFQPTVLSGSGTTNIPLTSSTCKLVLGGVINTSAGFSHHSDTRISQFKLYDTALTAEEARTLYDMGRNGSVANPQPLHIAAPLYAPGVPVQIVSNVYKKQVAYGSTNSDRNIKELDISIKPKFANSRILLHWMINGELHQDNVIRVARDGSYIIHGYNETQGTNQWSGVAAGGYDQNQDSTPENYCIDTYDEPGGTNTYNYQIYIGSSGGGSFPAHINRTYTGGNRNAHEAGICFMSATEIAQ
tara:strand:+ start:66 stop:1256 length:1191 start_codon:yes stop_codon:yes gene_type:complete